MICRNSTTSRQRPLAKSWHTESNVILQPSDTFSTFSFEAQGNAFISVLPVKPNGISKWLRSLQRLVMYVIGALESDMKRCQIVRLTFPRDLLTHDRMLARPTGLRAPEKSRSVQRPDMDSRKRYHCFETRSRPLSKVSA